MSARIDGGLAFPGSRQERVESSALGGARMVEVTYPGMSLRDYFAAKALTISPHGNVGGDGLWATHEQIAAWAYRVADAMLKAREAK
jgi:hypothetical protein